MITLESFGCTTKFMFSTVLSKRDKQVYICWFFSISFQVFYQSHGKDQDS